MSLKTNLLNPIKLKILGLRTQYYCLSPNENLASIEKLRQIIRTEFNPLHFLSFERYFILKNAKEIGFVSLGQEDRNNFNYSDYHLLKELSKHPNASVGGIVAFISTYVSSGKVHGCINNGRYTLRALNDLTNIIKSHTPEKREAILKKIDPQLVAQLQ